MYAELINHQILQAKARLESYGIPLEKRRILLANDEVIEKNEFELAIKGIPFFFINWNVNTDYRDLIRDILKNGKIYVMHYSDGKDWHFKEASKNDIEIHDLEGMVDITPKYNQTLTV